MNNIPSWSEEIINKFIKQQSKKGIIINPSTIILDIEYNRLVYQGYIDNTNKKIQQVIANVLHNNYGKINLSVDFKNSHIIKKTLKLNKVNSIYNNIEKSLFPHYNINKSNIEIKLKHSIKLLNTLEKFDITKNNKYYKLIERHIYTSNLFYLDFTILDLNDVTMLIDNIINDLYNNKLIINKLNDILEKDFEKILKLLKKEFSKL